MISISNHFDYFWDEYKTDNCNYLEKFNSSCLIKILNFSFKTPNFDTYLYAKNSKNFGNHFYTFFYKRLNRFFFKMVFLRKKFLLNTIFIFKISKCRSLLKTKFFNCILNVNFHSYCSIKVFFFQVKFSNLLHHL